MCGTTARYCIEIKNAPRLSTLRRTRARKEVGSELDAVTNEQPSDRTTRALFRRVWDDHSLQWSGHERIARSRRRAVHGCCFDAKWWAFRHARLDHRSDVVDRWLPRCIEHANVRGSGMSDGLGVQVLRSPPAKNHLRARYVGCRGRRRGTAAVETGVRRFNKQETRTREAVAGCSA
jgi:hypothetical protein